MAHQPKVAKRKVYHTRKHKVYLYFETKQQIALIRRAAAKAQESPNPNISRYCVEAALNRMKLDLAEEHTKHTLPGA